MQWRGETSRPTPAISGIFVLTVFAAFEENFQLEPAGNTAAAA
jgi:hypothetical protein